jgi:hypothetical protein
MDDTDEEEEDPSVHSRVRLTSKKLVKWNPFACSSHLEISSAGLGIKYDGPGDMEAGDYRGCAVLAN